MCINKFNSGPFCYCYFCLFFFYYYKNSLYVLFLPAATHLSKCEKRSAYPNPGVEAQSASFPPLVTLDDGEGPAQDPNDQWMKAYSKPKEDEKPTSAPTSTSAPSGKWLDKLLYCAIDFFLSINFSQTKLVKWVLKFVTDFVLSILIFKTYNVDVHTYFLTCFST